MYTINNLGKIIGAKTFWFDETESTNALAHNAITDKIENGAVFVADNQTRGRGQRTNTWESEPYKNLTLSIIIYPNFLSAENQFLISKAASLAVADLLKENGLHATIKWPNDIYVGDKKITGILIEHNISGKNIASTIIGVGLNVNQQKFVSDAPNPTSMQIEAGHEFDRKLLLQRLLFLFEKRYIAMAEQNFADIEKDYFAALYRRNGFFKYIDVNNGKRINAKIVGIMNTGELLLETDNGCQRKFAFKEIAFVI